ncbi:MAG: hypothetical protein HC897_02065 [Thermoanaerobaculia bacterium]|nr:hypothetical protein [Thermoanaerobaculia bacterium]
MQPIRDPQIKERLQAVLDLYETAEEMMRMKIRRRNPSLSDEEVEQQLIRWLEKRPDFAVGSEPESDSQQLWR